jgi:hypothetical protein
VDAGTSYTLAVLSPIETMIWPAAVKLPMIAIAVSRARIAHRRLAPDVGVCTR